MLTKFNRKARVVLIDDDPAMVRLLSRFLERSFGDSIVVMAFTEPNEARRAINTNVVDILITDLQLPGSSGLELLRTAKRRNAFTQVLLVTGHSSHEALLDALELGATDYLLKPIEHHEFTALIEEALGRHKRWRLALSQTLCPAEPVTVAEWI